MKCKECGSHTFNNSDFPKKGDIITINSSVGYKKEEAIHDKKVLAIYYDQRYVHAIYKYVESGIIETESLTKKHYFVKYKKCFNQFIYRIML